MEVYYGCVLEISEFFDWLDGKIFTREQRQKPERFRYERLLKYYFPEEKITEIEETGADELLRNLWEGDLLEPVDFLDFAGLGEEEKLQVWIVSGYSYMLIGNKLNIDKTGSFCSLSSFMRNTKGVKEEIELALIDVGLSDFEFDTYYFNKSPGIYIPNDTNVCKEIDEMIEKRLGEQLI